MPSTHGSTAIQVHRAGHADLSILVDLCMVLERYHASLDARLGPGEYSSVVVQAITQGMAESLTADDCAIFVATVQGKPAGYVRAKLFDGPLPSVPKLVRVTDLLVTEPYRRRGVGRGLVAAVAEWCHEGAATMAVSLAARNEDALAFYRALGLEPITIEMMGWPRDEEATPAVAKDGMGT